MARIRTIKPDFFRHLNLYKAELKTKLPLRVAFAGLWTACDREGRFKWKPEELKLDCLPYDHCDFSVVLDSLWIYGFIEKYTFDEKIFGFIPSWNDHQSINNRESSSVLPNPYESMILTCGSRVGDASQSCISGREGKGREKEGKRKGNDASFIPPSEKEIIDYFIENGYEEETAKKMFQSYSVADWFDSKGNKVKNWKQKAINVWFKPENKANNQIKYQHKQQAIKEIDKLYKSV